MRKTITFLLIVVCFYSCSEKKETIDFTTLTKTEFNVKPFELPNYIASDSLKQAHDNCMGFSFDANALFVQTKDTFRIGTIVNRQSLKILNTVNDLGLTRAQTVADFNIIANPCYEKRVLNFPLRSILGEKFILQLPNADTILNKEINDAISAAGDAEMQTGSWLYLDMKDALKRILDTAKTPEILQYKKNLLDTSNMVLSTVESITDVSFIIETKKDISAPLQALLKTKPYASPLNAEVSIKVVYISGNRFEIILNGFFPVVGAFAKATLK